MAPLEHSHARLRVALSALVDNYQLLAKTASPSNCGAVVKADAYGLGMVPVAKALHTAGCRQFFVSEAFEGVSLRKALEGVDIYVLSGITAATVEACLQGRLIPVLSSEAQVNLWRTLAKGGEAAAVKVDTGMTRLGLPWDEFNPEALSRINVCLLMTHLACADTPSHPLNNVQLERFAKVRAALPGVATSVGNSAGTLIGKDTRGDLCRCGIGIYGGNPFADRENPFKPVAHLEGQVLQMRTMESDAAVGYGASFQTSRTQRLAVIGVGYANGLPRTLSNLGEAYFDGHACPIAGRVSMNLTTITVPPDSGLDVGDWVEFIGAARPLDEVATVASTIGYEILTGLKAPRLYET